MNSEIQFLLYSLPDEEGKVQVIVKDETIWCTQKAMAQLFGVGVPAISKTSEEYFSGRRAAERSGCFQNGNNHSTWRYGRQDANIFCRFLSP